MRRQVPLLKRSELGGTGRLAASAGAECWGGSGATGYAVGLVREAESASPWQGWLLVAIEYAGRRCALPRAILPNSSGAVCNVMEAKQVARAERDLAVLLASPVQ